MAKLLPKKRRPRGDFGVSGAPLSAQRRLQGGDVPPVALRVSRDSVAPVGVGGVTMMEGTCRCLSPAAGTPPAPFPLLTHVFKPRGGDSIVGSTLYEPPENPRIPFPRLPTHPAGCRSL